MSPDYSMGMTVEQFIDNFGRIYRGEGWYVHERTNDTILALHHPDDAKRLRIHVWSKHDPRPEILRLVGLPNRTEAAIIPV